MKIKCGHFIVEIYCNETYEIPKNTIQFIDNSSSKVDIKCKLEFVDKIEFNNETIIHQRQNIIVTKNDRNLESRYLIISGTNYPYTLYREIDEENINIQVLRKFKDKMNSDTFFWSLFSMEKYMIQRESIILHCNYIEYKNNAILFSGPSGIGKSTQGDLWKKHNNVTILNGDKSLIIIEGHDIYVDGLPICGSSDICINQKNNLGAIVFLKQGTTNKVKVLDKKIAIKYIMSQITINYWDKDFVDRAFSIAETICDNINIYELTCTPDIKAVKTLEKMLKENEEWMC